MSTERMRNTDLTQREREILRLIAEGLRNKEIAHRLAISPKTMEFHKTQIYDRIGVSGVVGAVRFAIKEGYLEP